MTHSSTIASTILLVTLAFACDKASDEQKKMNAARTEADDKSSAAMSEATAKLKGAQQEADDKVGQAQAAFMKMREDYRHATTVNLVELDRQVGDLEAKAKQSAGQPRSDLDANLKQIHADRRTFEADWKSLDGATAATWDEAKIRLDKEWTHLKSLVDHA